MKGLAKHSKTRHSDSWVKSEERDGLAADVTECVIATRENAAVKPRGLPHTHTWIDDRQRRRSTSNTWVSERRVVILDTDGLHKMHFALVDAGQGRERRHAGYLLLRRRLSRKQEVVCRHSGQHGPDGRDRSEKRTPSRELHIDADGSKKLRSKLCLSWSKFAALLHVDVGTLRN